MLIGDATPSPCLSTCTQMNTKNTEGKCEAAQMLSLGLLGVEDLQDNSAKLQSTNINNHF